MLTDLRLFFRNFQKNPISFVITILVLSLAVGSATSVIAVGDLLMINPVPTRDLDRIVHVVGLVFRTPEGEATSWWGQASALDAIASYFAGEVYLEGGGGQAWVSVGLVSSKFFSVFQNNSPTAITVERRSREASVAVVSNSLWQTYFGGAAFTVGSRIRLNGIPYEVVDVAPRGFDFPGGTDIWVVSSDPLSEPLKMTARSQSLRLFGRTSGWVGLLKVHNSIPQAASNLNMLLQALKEEYGARTKTQFGDRIVISPLREYLGTNYRPALMALSGGTIFALLAASASCSLFLMSRSAARRKEIALRQVFGASVTRILRQMATEALALASVTWLFSLVVFFFILNFLRIQHPSHFGDCWNRLPYLGSILGIAWLFAIAVCVFPATLTAIRLDSNGFWSVICGNDYLGGARSGQGRRLVLLLQFTSALVLTIGALLCMRTFANLKSFDYGYSRDGFVTRLNLARQKNVVEFSSRIDEVVALLERQTTGSPVGMSSENPASSPAGGQWVLRENDREFCLLTHWGGDYFRAVGTTVIAGKLEEVDAPSVLISEGLAKRFWGAKDPLGRELLLEGEDQPRIVVGVIGNTKAVDLSVDFPYRIYLSYTKPYRSLIPSGPVYAFYQCSEGCNVSSITRALHQHLGFSFVGRAMRISDVVTTEMSASTLLLFLLGAYSALTLGMTFVSSYALSSYSSLKRAAELGIRVALGAKPVDILRLAMLDITTSIVAGLLLGGLLSLWAMRFLRGLLFGMTPFDLWSLLTGVAVLVIGTVASFVIPVGLLLRRNPMDLLRCKSD